LGYATNHPEHKSEESRISKIVFSDQKQPIHEFKSGHNLAKVRVASSSLVSRSGLLFEFPRVMELDEFGYCDRFRGTTG
jgi:hypothetical protein